MTKDEEKEMLEKIRKEVEMLQDGFPETDIFVNVIYPIPGQPGNENYSCKQKKSAQKSTDIEGKTRRKD